MARHWMVVWLLGIAGLAALLIANAPSNPDGWRDPGVHVVDGYWLTEERPCQSGSGSCGMMLEAVADDLRHDGVVDHPIKASAAGFPIMRGGGRPMFAGLMTPRFLILDLADGRRRTFPLMCGAMGHVNDRVQMGCTQVDLDMFRVGNGWMADR